MALNKVRSIYQISHLCVCLSTLSFSPLISSQSLKPGVDIAVFVFIGYNTTKETSLVVNCLFTMEHALTPNFRL